jgi:type 1 glutamine amidotransferase
MAKGPETGPFCLAGGSFRDRTAAATAATRSIICGMLPAARRSAGVFAVLCAVVFLRAPAPSAVAQGTGPKKLLFLTHPALYKHASLEYAEKAVVEWGADGGFAVTTLEGYKQPTREIDLTVLTPEYLAQFDGLMLMTNGNLPLTDQQKQLLIDFVRNGKALIGTHCATLTLYNYPAFGEMIGGYYLRSVIPTDQVGRKVGVLKVEDRDNPATRALGTNWRVNEEFYRFGTEVWSESKPTENRSQVGSLPIPLAFSRDRVHVLLSLDTGKMDISDLPQLTPGGDYPQAWTRNYGRGRVFYTALGHREDIWSTDPLFKAHVVGGIRWALNIEN